MDRTRTRASRRGSALTLALISVVVLGGISYSLMAVTVSGSREADQYRDEMRAFYVAESALNEAYLDLENGGDGEVATEAAPADFAGSAYFVTATDQGGGVTSLVATSFDGDSSARVELVVSQQSGGLFQYAAFGDDGVHLDSNALVDSYDSTAGSYSSQVTNKHKGTNYAGDSGTVGSNADITSSSNVKIFGDATPGPTGSVTTDSNVYISGSTAPASAPVALPAVTVPTVAYSGNYVKTSNGTFTIASGDYHFGKFELNSNTVLNIVGPATLVVDEFILDSNVQVFCDTASGPVEIYGTGDFTISSNASLKPLNESPGDVSIQLSSTGSATIDLNSNGGLWATIYAPQADVVLDSNFILYGAAIAKSLLINSNAQVHYDESLGSAGNGAGGGLEVVLWRPLSESQAANL